MGETEEPCPGRPPDAHCRPSPPSAHLYLQTCCQALNPTFQPEARAAAQQSGPSCRRHAKPARSPPHSPGTPGAGGGGTRCGTRWGIKWTPDRSAENRSSWLSPEWDRMGQRYSGVLWAVQRKRTSILALEPRDGLRALKPEVNCFCSNGGRLQNRRKEEGVWPGKAEEGKNPKTPLSPAHTSLLLL